MGEDFFKPVISDYAKRDYSRFFYPSADITTQRVYYNVYELSVKEGENTLSVLLGNGFFRQKSRLNEGCVCFGERLILAYAVDLKEGALFTDGTELCSESFITFNNVFYGETHDYSGWSETPFLSEEFKNSVRVSVIEPTAILTEQNCPNEKAERIIKPKLLLKKEGKAIYDAGENITGFVQVRPLSQTITITHAEVFNGERLDYFSAGGENQIQKTQYINAENRLVHPWFHWSGFRYFDVEGDFSEDSLEVVVVHTGQSLV